MRTHCTTQGTILNALWWPKWEGNPKKGDICGSSDGRASACNAGDMGLIPGLGRSSGEGNGYSLQYSCLEKSVDRGVLLATVHGVAKSQTRLSDEHSMCVYSWFTVPYSRSWHSSGKQLYSNQKKNRICDLVNNKVPVPTFWLSYSHICYYRWGKCTWDSLYYSWTSPAFL